MYMSMPKDIQTSHARKENAIAIYHFFRVAYQRSRKSIRLV